MFRHRGRRIYAGNLRARRLLLSLGSYPLYVPRGISPYVVARKLARAAGSEAPEISFVRELLARRRSKPASEPQSHVCLESTDAPADPVAA